MEAYSADVAANRNGSGQTPLFREDAMKGGISWPVRALRRCWLRRSGGAVPRQEPKAARSRRSRRSCTPTSRSSIPSGPPAYITQRHANVVYDTPLCAQLEIRAETADGGERDGQPGRAALHLHAAPGPGVPRQPAGASGRLHREHQALVGGAIPMGQLLATFMADMAVVDDRSFSMTLKNPMAWC